MSDSIISPIVPGPDSEQTVLDRMREIIDSMPDGVVTVDSSWRFTYANRRALEIVNLPDVTGADIFELFPGNREEPFFSTYTQAMEQRIEGGFEAYHPAPLNLWVKVEAKPLVADGIIIFFSDISARKNAELREQATAQRLADTLGATSDAVLSLDRNWTYTFLNENAYRLIDPARRLLGKHVWDEFPFYRDQPIGQMLQRAMHDKLSGETVAYYDAPIDAWICAQAQPSPDGIVIFFRDVTEQKRHDEQIRKQQGLLAAVQRAARVVTWDLDPETGLIRYGESSFSISGHSRSELATVDQIQKLVPHGHEQIIPARIAQAVATGELVITEFPLLSVEGPVLWIESRGQAVTLDDGSTRIRGMSIDITQRKLDEVDLIASEERYRVLADLNPQAIWMGNSEGQITYANQGFLTYLGIGIDDLAGTGWLDGFAPFERERIVDIWTHSVKTGVDYDVEAMLCHAASQEYRYWHLRAAPVRDPAGNILHWLGVGSDIHDSKTYAATLRAEQIESDRKRAELEAIYKSIPVALALLDPVEFRVLNANDLEAELLGVPLDRLLGMRVEDVAPLPGLSDIFRRVALGEIVKDQLIEGQLATTGSLKRSWSVNYSPVYNEHGQVRAISSAVLEITNQKRAEAALIQSEKLAAVGRLASSISHEINNPLEAITNLLYLIAMDRNLHESLKIYVHMAQSELSRVSQIATQTLRFHRQAINATSVTARELVGAVIQLYTGRLANSSIRVDERYNTDSTILCFENDIRQVLNNLIANAIDAMRSGGRLFLRAHATGPGSAGHADAPSGVRITIADTGHGMPAEVLARIFEPFYTTKDLQGTGLGLWISQGIVERHQGRLTVRSSTHPNHHGTVFTLFLPCSEK